MKNDLWLRAEERPIEQICEACSLLCKKAADTHWISLMEAESPASQELYGPHTLSSWISPCQGQEFTPKVHCLLSGLLQQKDFKASVWFFGWSRYPFAIFQCLNTFSKKQLNTRQGCQQRKKISNNKRIPFESNQCGSSTAPIPGNSLSAHDKALLPVWTCKFWAAFYSHS